MFVVFVLCLVVFRVVFMSCDVVFVYLSCRFRCICDALCGVWCGAFILLCCVVLVVCGVVCLVSLYLFVYV